MSSQIALAGALAPPPPLDAAPRAPRGDRVTATLLAGRLIDAHADHLCRVRNVSEGGMMVECTVDVAVGASVDIQVRQAAPVPARVVWIDGLRIGLSASAPIDVRAMLRPAPGRFPRRAVRSPRLAAAARVHATCDGRTHAGILLDLSQGGCGIAFPDAPGGDGPVRIAIPGLPARVATRRWIGDDVAGYVFLEPLTFADISAWQGDLRRRFSDKR